MDKNAGRTGGGWYSDSATDTALSLSSSSTINIVLEVMRVRTVLALE